MSPLVATAFGALALAAALAGIRWTRVAQREHYLAGSATRFAWRWWTGRPVNAALALVGVGAAAGAVPLRWPAYLVALVVAVGPVGLGLRGRTGRLRWTRRCAVVAATTLVLCAGVVALVVLGLGTGAGLLAGSLVTLGLFLLEDLALALLAPVEDRLAEGYVRRASTRLERVGPRVVAITGSYGKTTTKGYVAHLLAGRFSVLASPKSYNNRAGLTRTVNELLVPWTEVLVAEMGTYGPGEIRALCGWLRPEVAVLTAIGPVHLERFRSLERTLEAKAEITEGAKVVVCNVDDQRLAGLADRLEGEGRQVVRCSAGGAGADRADVEVVPDGEELVVKLAGGEVGRVALPRSAAPGTLSNVACALGAALALGCEPAEVLDRLAGLPGTENRLESGRSEGGLVVLDDTFNANPAGARVALSALAAAGANGARRVLVTPGMVELGPLQARENAALAKDAARVVTDLVVVGRTNRRALLAGLAEATGSPDRPTPRAVAVPSRAEAVAWVRRELAEGDAVLYENDLPDHYP